MDTLPNLEQTKNNKVKEIIKTKLSTWNKLYPSQKISLIAILSLLLILPLGVTLVLGPKPRVPSRAYLPTTPPTPPNPSNTSTPTIPCKVSLKPDLMKLKVGTSSKFTADVLISSNVKSIDRVEFVSSNTKFVTVNPDKDYNKPYETIATGKSEGKAEVKATVFLKGLNSPGCMDTSFVDVTP